MRRLVLALLLLPSAAAAQDAVQPTFRATTRLIVQTVSVKDRNGKPVGGLTANDFVVTENGRPQDIAFVDYEPLDATTTPTPAVAAFGESVPPVTREGVAVPRPGDARHRGRRLLVLYFDLYRMGAADQLRAYDGARRYVDAQMSAADTIAVMVFKGRGVELRQDFTSDRAVLRGVVEDLEKAANDSLLGIADEFDPGGAFGENDDAFNLFTTDRQLSALQTAATDLAPLPQVKTLIYFGAGLRAGGAENMAQLRATVNAAVRANVTLNPIDTRGLAALPPLGDATRASPGGIGMFSGTIAEAAMTRGQQSQDALYALAKDTGGRAMFDDNDLSAGIAQAARAVTGYYLVGYYTTNTSADGRFRRVTIALRDGLSAELSYRRGYYGEKTFAAFTAADKERQLAEALKLEDPITEIPMAMEVNYFQVSQAEYFVPVSVRMPGRELARPRTNGAVRAEIDVIGEIKDDFGVTVRNARDRLTFTLDPAAAARVSARPIQYEAGFSLLPGHYVIKVLARDATTGRIGTFQRAFAIPNLERERVRLPISSVVLTSERAARGDALFTVRQAIPHDVAHPLVAQGYRLIPGVTREFSARRPLFVFLQSYERDASAMRPLAAYVSFYRAGALVFETDTLGITEWDPRSKAVPIRFTIPLTRLPPGSYDCQVTVLDPGAGRAAFWRAAIVVVR